MPTQRTVDPAYALTGPNQQTIVQAVEAPAGHLWRALTDDRAWEQWLDLSITWTSSPPHGEGSTRKAVLGAGPANHELFTRWEEGERFSFCFVRSALPLAAFAEDYLVQPLGPDRSQLTWSYAYEFRGGPLAPLLAAGFEAGFGRIARRGVGRLANLVESEPARFADQDQ